VVSRRDTPPMRPTGARSDAHMTIWASRSMGSTLRNWSDMGKYRIGTD
jgi:hypothetical protein